MYKNMHIFGTGKTDGSAAKSTDALPEDLDSVSSTNMAAYKHLYL